jgi:hypothetical protein
MVDEIIIPLQLAVALAALEVLDVPIAAPVLPASTKDRLVANFPMSAPQSFLRFCDGNKTSQFCPRFGVKKFGARTVVVAVCM